MAGLKAADVLTSHGFDVTILEGRDRIGGRVSVVVLHHDRDTLRMNRFIRVLTSVIL